ncbi:hypothetical protein NDN08_007839 [Rhodosorus marinus]|uniref:Uncharacterized protein n=1 Tax=Rhodosorus marinus TaxID=101924 RepID=A0AAV8V2S8_9RHOD|nr:hypothetical protein NDN08_007839 [Rhodosorus marinus]
MDSAEGGGLYADLEVGNVLSTHTFLLLVDESPVLRSRAGLVKALKRYLKCWIPILNRVGAEAALLALPSDIAWIWFVHLCQPQQYYKDFTKLTGKFPTHRGANPVAAALRPRGGQAWLNTAKIWKTYYPTEAFENLEADDSLPAISDTLHLSSHELTDRLVSEAQTQLNFYYQVSLPHYQSRLFLERAIERYKKYLDLCGRYPKEHFLPPYDVNLVWRTHMACGVKYVEESIKVAGRMLVHDSNILQLAFGNTRASMIASSEDRFLNEFGEPLFDSGTVARGPRPRLALMRERWVGKVHIDGASLEGLQIDGRSYRPVLGVSGQRGGAGTVRKGLERDAQGRWQLQKKISVQVDGRAGADLHVEVALKQAKLMSLTSNVPKKSYLSNMRLDTLKAGPLSSTLELRSLGSSRDEASILLSYRVDSKSPKGALTMVVKEPVEPMIACVGRARAKPFQPPERMESPLRREMFIIDESQVGFGLLKVEHYYDGVRLQRPHAVVSFNDLSGALTSCARLISPDQLVSDPSLVWNRQELVGSQVDTSTLMFSITIGRKDWGVVRGTWQGYTGRRGANPGQSGSLHMTVARLVNTVDEVAETAATVVAPGRGQWRLYSGKSSTVEELVTANPDDGSINIGCALEPEAGLLLTCCASLFTVFLCPPPAVVAGTRPGLFSSKLYRISGVEVGGLIGKHLRTNSNDAKEADRFMGSVRNYFASMDAFSEAPSYAEPTSFPGKMEPRSWGMTVESIAYNAGIDGDAEPSGLGKSGASSGKAAIWFNDT